MTAAPELQPDAPITLGLRANLSQFALLALVNAFVGGMVGLQRTLVPLIGAQEFDVASVTLVTSFIVSFGLVKAFANLVSGPLADRYGRKRLLVAGWLFGVPVPFMLMFAPSWGWIIAANALLGVNQGLAWSMTVNMKIDLVGPARRGVALGLNEFAGYFAVGVTAWATGLLAAEHGLRPAPLWIGVGYVAIGLALSIFLIRDTRAHTLHESNLRRAAGASAADDVALSFRQVFSRTTWRDRNLFAVTQAGFVNNLNDGMAWGVFPLLFAAYSLSIERIGLIAAVYPAAWGVGQLFTGAMSDKWGRKPFIVGGMIVQALGHAVIGFGADHPFQTGLTGSLLLGVGTAMVYPTLLAAVGDVAHPAWRARALSVYRFWRDMGYAAGALLAGLIADAMGLLWAVHAAGALTLASGLLAWAALKETKNSP